jgi:ubiquinone/menaquinone biosynthesis C-methylase UbiE
LKGRESGMPEEEYWTSFFDVDCILTQLQCTLMGTETIVEFGSGYGTFTLPAARQTVGEVITFDIEPEMVQTVQNKAAAEGLTNIQASVRDFIDEGSGLSHASIDHVMIYNLLHVEQSLDLLREAHRVLKPNGMLSVIHWNHDPDTPRGPPMNIRPRPEDCIELAQRAGFDLVTQPDLSQCAEHHYGIIFTIKHEKPGMNS